MPLIKTAIRNKEGEKKPTRYFSKKQETAVANTVNGKRTKNSGATMFGGKSDVSIESLFSIECKTKMTSAKSITIKKDWLEKLNKEALFDGHPYSALAFNYGPNESNYYIIDEDLFIKLCEVLKDEPSE